MGRAPGRVVLYEIFDSQEWLHLVVPGSESAGKFETGNCMQLAYFGGRGFFAFANFHSFCAPGFELATGFMERQVRRISRYTLQPRSARGLAFGELRRETSE